MESVSKKPRIEAISSTDKRKQVESILGEYILTEDTIKKIIDAFEEHARLGNSGEEAERKKSDFLWQCTYVTKLLTGNENGQFLGLDLGGTNFRVVGVTFTDGTAEMTTKYYNLSPTLLSGTVEGVFDHIAESMEKFLQEQDWKFNKPLPVGFTFSFPSIQTSLKCSTLTSWTKCFQCTNGIGSDPCVMLEEAIQRRGGLSTPVNIVAVLSDTTATFMAGNYEDKMCRIGMIIVFYFTNYVTALDTSRVLHVRQEMLTNSGTPGLASNYLGFMSSFAGTGSNACFVENVKNCHKINQEDTKAKQVVINTEWQSFGDGGCLDFMKTDLDVELDKYSNHPGEATFEKMFSGLYLGELVRMILAKMTKEGLLFNGVGSELLFKRLSFETKYVTAIEADEGDLEGNTTEILTQLGLGGIATSEDISLVREVCAIISQRGAYCVAAATAVLLYHIGLPEVTIAVDGSVFEHHPKYEKYMNELISKWVPKTKAKFILVKDGSGSGAAFVAAAESH